MPYRRMPSRLYTRHMNPADSAPVRRAYDYRFRADGVSVSRGGARIVTGVSISLDPGEAAILRGPNGAGKTTLLRAFAGFLRIDEGSVGVQSGNGAALDDPRGALIYCGPLNAVKSGLTVDENLHFWAALHGSPKSAIIEARAAFGLESFAQKSAGALSTGYCRRLGLSRLMLARKAIWFVDEPTASLDAASAGAFEKLVERHRAEGGIAVIATHDACAISNARKIELRAEASA